MRKNYFISNGVLLEECYKEDNVEVNLGCYYFLCENKIIKRSAQSHSHHQTRISVINIQSTLRTAPICVKIFHCSVIW